MNKEQEIKADEFSYMMLSRVSTDMEQFLTEGNWGYHSEKSLWAGNVIDQIEEMKKLYEKIVHKPEWLSMEDILSYEKQCEDLKIKGII